MTQARELATFASGDFPAGHVIQTKTSIFKDLHSFTIGGANNNGNNGESDAQGTSTTRGNDTWGGIIPGLEVAITKRASSSHFLVTFNLMGCTSNQMAAAYNWFYNIYTSVDSYANPIQIGNTRSGSDRRVMAGFRSYYNQSSYNAYNSKTLSGQAKYSPSISSGTSVTFKSLIFSSYNIVVELNVDSTPSNNAANGGAYTSSVIIQEIAGT